MLHWANWATRGSACSSCESLLSPLEAESWNQRRPCWIALSGHWGVEIPQCGIVTSRINISYFLLIARLKWEHLSSGGFKILGPILYFARTHYRRDLYYRLYEEFHGLKESAKSMSSNCVLGGAVESNVMKTDWTVIASSITSLVTYEYR